MEKKHRGSRAVLAFDTSAYTTSAAAAAKGGIVCADERIHLSVEKGERGLRQSQALFQHINNIAELTEMVCEKIERVGLHDRSRCGQLEAKTGRRIVYACISCRSEYWKEHSFRTACAVL